MPGLNERPLSGQSPTTEGRPTEPESLDLVAPPHRDEDVFAASGGQHSNTGEQQNEDVMLAPYSELGNVNFRVSEGHHEESLPERSHLQSHDTRTSSAAIIGMGLLSAFILVFVVSLWEFAYRLDSRLSELEQLVKQSNDVGASAAGDPQNNDVKMQPDDVEEQPDADVQAPSREGRHKEAGTDQNSDKNEADSAKKGIPKELSVQEEEKKADRSPPTSKGKKGKKGKAADPAKETPGKKTVENK